MISDVTLSRAEGQLRILSDNFDFVRVQEGENEKPVRWGSKAGSNLNTEESLDLGPISSKGQLAVRNDSICVRGPSWPELEVKGEAPTGEENNQVVKELVGAQVERENVSLTWLSQRD